MNSIWTMTMMGAFLGAAALNAQNPLSTDAKNSYDGIKNTITKAAEEMPEADYSFKASPPERTYGAIVGHIADVQMALCGNAKGEHKMGDAEKTKTTKADLVAALKASFDYCDGAYDSMTDADAASQVTMFGPRKATKLRCSTSTSPTTTKCTDRWWCTFASKAWCRRPASVVNPSAIGASSAGARESPPASAICRRPRTTAR